MGRFGDVWGDVSGSELPDETSARLAWVIRAATQDEFEQQGRLKVIEKGEPFQVLPTTEPAIVCEIWVFEVLG